MEINGLIYKDKTCSKSEIQLSISMGAEILCVLDAQNALQAHIRCGAAGEPTAVVVETLIVLSSSFHPSPSSLLSLLPSLVPVEKL